MNNFINISDLSKSELRSIIDGAKKRKSERGKKPHSEPDTDQPLKGKTMIMIFEKTSTRTRISFDLAVKQLGGSSIILNQDEIHDGKGDETIKDTAKVLSQYADILMIRTDSHENVDEFKKHVDVTDYNSARRFLAFFIYLNDNKGGQTFFPDYKIKINPVAGKLLMFPPLWTHLHSGLKPIKNPKYIVGSYLHYV